VPGTIGIHSPMLLIINRKV